MFLNATFSIAKHDLLEPQMPPFYNIYCMIVFVFSICHLLKSGCDYQDKCVYLCS